MSHENAVEDGAPGLVHLAKVWHRTNVRFPRRLATVACSYPGTAMYVYRTNKEVTCLWCVAGVTVWWLRDE